MSENHGIGRGNWTNGPQRRGQRGRPPLAERAATTTVRLSERHMILARYLGRGNASEGLRIALDALAGFLRNPVGVFETLYSYGRYQHLAESFLELHKELIPLEDDVRQALAFLKRAVEDSPAGEERAGGRPHCYDHPEHDPECGACRVAYPTALPPQDPAPVKPAEDLFSKVTPAGETVTIDGEN